MIEQELEKIRRRILIVDDIAFNQRVLEKIITKMGHKIIQATSGEQALQLVEIDYPDLILLDFKMPGMDGIEVLKLLKEDVRYREIPVIFLTATEEIDAMTEAFAAGAVDYITKPFKTAELNARVNTQLRALDHAESIRRKIIEQHELIHILTHDLRNPLVACRGLMELLEDGDTIVEMVAPNVANSLQKCLNTIELVRKKGLLEQEMAKLDLETYDLLELIQEVLASWETAFTDKNVKLINRVSEGIQVKVDKTSFIQIFLSNIISNALKYSYPDSEVEIYTEDTENETILKVRDKGMGIPQYMLPIIFEPRKVTRRAGTLNEESTGYGLSLVKKLVMSYGGDMHFESKAKSEDTSNHGTTAVIQLPKIAA